MQTNIFVGMFDRVALLANHKSSIVWHVLFGHYGNCCLKLSSKQRVVREIHWLKQVQGCPRVPRVLWHGYCDDLSHEYGFVMDVFGESLSSIMSCHKFNISELQSLAKSLMHTLQCCHSKGVLHRDVKPSNIVMSCGIPYLIDFDCAGGVESRSSFRGTPLFCSDYVLRGGKQNRRNDFVCLCYTLYALEQGGVTWDNKTRPTLSVLSQQSDIVSFVFQLLKWKIK